MHLARGAAREGAAVDAEDDFGVQHLEQGLEVAVPRGGEERVDDLALPADIRVGDRDLALHPAPRPAGELARRLRRAVDHGSDLVEGDGEHVMEYEREPFGRIQRLEHDQQREADRVGEQRLVLRVDARPRGRRSARGRRA